MSERLSHHQGSLGPAIWADLQGDEEDPFGAAHLGLRWRPKEASVLLESRAGEPIASAGLVLVEVQVGGERDPLVVAGIGAVIVAPRHRGRGHARTVVLAILERAAELGLELAMLFCLPDRRGLYERLGFLELGAPVLVDGPQAPMAMPMHAMWRALRDGARWPPGAVSLRGLPF